MARTSLGKQCRKRRTDTVARMASLRGIVVAYSAADAFASEQELGGQLIESSAVQCVASLRAMD